MIIARTIVAISRRSASIGTAISFCSSPSSTMPCTAENRLRAVTPNSASRSRRQQRRERSEDMTEQIHLVADRPFRNRFSGRHAVFEQARARVRDFRPRNRNRRPRSAPASRPATAGRRFRRLSVPRRAAPACASPPEDQFIDVGDQIIDRAVGAADFPRQFPGLQGRQSACGNAPFRRKDQILPKFCSSFQCFRHFLPIS